MLYPKDPKVRVERHEKTLKIEWNWGGKGGLIWVVLAIVVMLLSIPVIQAPTMSGEPHGTWDIIGFLALFSCFAIPMTLGGLTSALNKTVIHADHERFLVRVSPLPWKRPRIVKAKEIQQFFVGSAPSNQVSLNNSLYLIDGQSHFISLGGVFPSSFAAHQICHELQDWYGLEDLPVFGQNTLPNQPGPRSK